MQKVRFGAWMRQRREDLGLTGEYLAKATGLTQSYISHIENGSRTPPPETCRVLATALRVNPARLYVMLGYLTESEVDCGFLPDDVDEVKSVMLRHEPNSILRRAILSVARVESSP